MALVNSTADIPSQGKKPAWFTEDVKDIPANARTLLEQYSHIAPDQVLPHVVEQQNKAFEIFPYPCIGQLRFLNLNLSSHPRYPQVLERVKKGQTLLDVGCCLGQDIRKLVVDGAQAENLYGTDVHGQFMDLGYGLFRDRETLKSTFFTKDILDPAAGWEEFNSRMDVISVHSFLHLFDRARQIKAARQLVKLLRPTDGSLIVGRQLGSAVPGDFPNFVEPGTNFRHNVESFEELWEQIGDEVGCRWRIEASLEEWGLFPKDEDHEWYDRNLRTITFTVTRQ